MHKPFFGRLLSKFGRGSTLSTLLFLVVSAILLLPLIIIASNIFKIDLTALTHLADTVLFRYLKNTVILVVLVSIVSYSLGTSLAWLIARYDFVGKNFFKIALIFPLAIPPYILGFTYNGIFDFTGSFQKIIKTIIPSLADTPIYLDILNLPGVIAVISLSFFPYVFLTVKSSLERQSMSVIEVAQLQGYSVVQTFFKLILPLSRPAIVAGLSLVIMETLNDYGTVKYFGVDTFTTGIFRAWFSMGDKPAALSLAVMLLTLVVLFLFIERTLRHKKKYDFSGMHYRPLQIEPLHGVKKLTATLYCSLILLISFMIPLLQLIYWFITSFQKMKGRDLLQPLVSTLFVSMIAIALIVTLALYLLFFQRNRNTRLNQIINRLNTIGYAIPGAIIALGVLITFVFFDKLLIEVFAKLWQYDLGLVLSGGLLLLIFAYIIRFLTVAYNSIDSGYSKIPFSVSEASKTLGRTPFTTFIKVEIPLLYPSIIGGAILVFMELIKELPLSLILRPFNFDTLATKAYEYATDEMLPESAYFSLILIITGVISIMLFNYLNRFFKQG